MMTEAVLVANLREALAYHETEERPHAEKAARLRRAIAILEGKADPVVVPAEPPPWPLVPIDPNPLPWHNPPPPMPGIIWPWTPPTLPYGEIVCNRAPATPTVESPSDSISGTT